MRCRNPSRLGWHDIEPSGRDGDIVDEVNGSPAARGLSRMRRAPLRLPRRPRRAHDFAVALGEESDRAGLLPDWLVNLVLDLGRAGLGAEAAAVGEALARVDPTLRSMLDGDVTIALDRAGMADQALAQVAGNLARWPRDIPILMEADEALLVLGDREGARTHFRAAVDLAEELEGFEARAEAIGRLDRLERLDRPERRGVRPEPGARPARRDNQARSTRSRRKRGR